MASYQEAGKKINARIKPVLEKMDPVDRKVLINGMLWMGQVAKYRCRQNTAYDRFCAIVFRGIENLHRSPITFARFDGSPKTFAVLQVKDTIDIQSLGED